MKLKHAIIETMDRDLLKTVCDDLEIDGIDRRSREDMAAAVSRARRAKPEELVEYLSEKQVKAVCELMRIEARGRRNALIKVLLNGAEEVSPLAAPSREQGNAGARPERPVRPRRNNAEEEVNWMSADQIEESAAEADVPNRPQKQAERQLRNGKTVSRAELVWPGKYDADGNLADPPRVSLPFQVIEVIEEGRASREALAQGTLPLFGAKPRGPDEEGWRNKLIWGDNLYVMGSLLGDFAGKVDLIYIDPPFATGADFTLRVAVGAAGDEVEKEPSMLEEKAYRDTWHEGTASYLRMMWDRFLLMRDLLSQTGSIFVHCDWHVSAFMRLMLDDIFGADNFVNEIVWYYYNKFQGNVNRFAANHDTVFWYSHGERVTFNPQKEKRGETVRQIKRAWDKEKGRIVNVKGPDGKVLYQETDERTVDDVWRISMLQPADRTQNTGYPTQKPEALLERILLAASQPGSLVADFFCGSGTTLTVAEKLGRRWIGADLGRFAVHTARKRLLDIRVPNSETGAERGCKPFEILNLGRYERKYWQGITFGGDAQAPDQAAIAAYVRFVLDLYNAQHLPGQHIHGKKAGVLVHVGAVDAPVTITQVEQALHEAKARGARELHVLGWEWEMGLHDPLAKMAKAQHGVTLRLLNIPREVMDRRAVDAGDVQFFDLAYLEVDVRSTGKGAQASRRIKVRLKDFVIPNTDLLPDDVRSKIRKWSDYIDYWAVDWDFRDDTFVNQWQTYRTRRDRSLAVETPEHTYEAPGKYRILVKVVDIFGNDTSHLLEWEAK